MVKINISGKDTWFKCKHSRACVLFCEQKLVEHTVLNSSYLNQDNPTIKIEGQAVLIWTKILRSKINPVRASKCTLGKKLTQAESHPLLSAWPRWPTEFLMQASCWSLTFGMKQPLVILTLRKMQYSKVQLTKNPSGLTELFSTLCKYVLQDIF